MKEISRRKAISLGALIGCTASIGLGHTVAFAQSLAQPIVPALVPYPPQPMRLSRRLDRSLHGGAILTVNRSWQVEFSRRDQGIAISGVQLQAEVDAPSSLAHLAEMERARSTAHLWPILLNSNGQFMVTGGGTNEEAFTAAIHEAEQMIAQRELPESQQAAQRQFLAEMQRVGSSMLDRLPDDLFFPIGRPLRSVREISLPGGLTGQFEVTYDAISASDGDWLERADRQVVTRIGQSEQRATELWVLTKL